MKRFVVAALLAVSVAGAVGVCATENPADAFLNRGNAYLAKGQNDQAIADYNQAIKLNPNYAEAFYGRGTAYQKKGQNDQAIADYDQAIKLNPNLAEAFDNRSAAYHAKGQLDQAIADYNQAIKLNPNLAAAPPPVPLVEVALSRLIDLAPESAGGTSATVAAGRTEASRCVQATQLASAYSSRILIKATGSKAEDIHWRVDYSAPDKYHVLQSSGQLFDEWITIGKENYRNAGLWLKMTNGEPELNRFFAFHKFLHILATAEPTSAIEYSSQDARYLLLEYREQLGADFTPFISKTATEPSQVRIWIDRQTNLLAKGEVTARDSANGTQLFLQQVFSGYGEAIRIEPPVIGLVPTRNKQTE